MRPRLLLAALFSALVLPVAAQTVSLHPGDAGMRVEIDGQLFTEYVIKDVPRPFFYPVIGAAGVNVVRNFPMKEGVEGEPADHKHHRGLWFAHGAVNGMDFWMEEKNFGTQAHVSFGEIKAEGSKGQFTATTRWVAPDGLLSKGKTVMTDTRKFTITAHPDGERHLDFDITLEATEGDVVLGDTKEGTMAIRLSPSLCFKGDGATGHAFNSEGKKDKAIWGKAANWVAYHGPDPEGNEVGVIMFAHPSNFRSPMTWHAREYGLFASNPFGLRDFKFEESGETKIAKGESLTLRHRFYFSKGTPAPDKLEARFQTYAAE